MKRVAWRALFCMICLFPLGASSYAQVSFVHDIAPVVLKRCTGCHGEKINLGGYRANTFQYLMKHAPQSPAPVVPGKPEDSQIYKLITAKSDAIRMPRSDDPLTPEQIGLIRRWIQEGAKFDGPDPTASLRSLLGPRTHPAAPAVYRAAQPVMAVAFAPGAGAVAVGGYNEVTVWNAVTGALERRIGRLPQRIQALEFGKDGRTLLVGGGTPGEYGEVTLVDTRNGERIRVLDTFADIVLTAVFSPDGKRVAAGGADMSVRVYDLDSGKRAWISNVHSDWVTSVSFSFDGRFVASASRDMTVKIHDGQDGGLFTTYNGHNRQIGRYKGQGPVYAVRFTQDSLLAVSAGSGRWLQLWDPIKAKEEAGSASDMEERFAKDGHARYIEHGFSQPVFALAVRDGQVFAASADGGIKQFDLAHGDTIHVYNGHTDWVYALDYDPGSHRLVSGAYNGEVRIWDTLSGMCLSHFIAQPGLHSATAGQRQNASASQSSEASIK